VIAERRATYEEHPIHQLPKESQTVADQDERVWKPSEIRQRYQAGERDFRDLEIDQPEKEDSFRGATLAGVDFSGAYIVADFSEANLSYSRFVGTNVKTCIFDRANLEHSDFSDAAIDSATFGAARLSGATFANASMYGITLKRGEFPDT